MENGGEGIDRLDQLPDHILHHILSFLDTKHSVQTSVLSNRWRSLWKNVTHLNFNRDSFTSYPCFSRFLKDALDAFGGDDSRIVKVSYKERNLWRRTHVRKFHGIMKYAKSHHIRHLRIHSGTSMRSNFWDLVGSFLNCDLDTLELGRVSVVAPLDWMGFRILENLAMEDCLLHCYSEKDIGFFTNFPCLKNLVLSDCDFVHAKKCFKVYGPQLLNLEIQGMNLQKAPVQIVAPKLKFFSYVFISVVPEFSQLSLPLLDHANIGSKYALHSVEEKKAMVTANFVNLFQGLHNATSLRLDYHIIQALSKICDGLEHQPCPFTRLKCLKVPCSEESCTIPPQLINYFLKGSSTTNPAAFLQFV
ncbi:unnamed protein product [Linum tenue]|uniref:F-box domain-containing protein n=1 Tax=Linum tenue TaxID=586396 RepID=A0AAV0JTP6_9ROSI|nr:unnamed protein product [Linum tenue]